MAALEQKKRRRQAVPLGGLGAAGGGDIDDLRLLIADWGMRKFLTAKKRKGRKKLNRKFRLQNSERWIFIGSRFLSVTRKLKKAYFNRKL